jgi:hypothetical protein
MLLVGGTAGCLLVLGNYTSKLKEERKLYAAYQETRRSDALSDRWLELRQQLPLLLVAALLSLPMLVMALLVPSLFNTSTSRWLLSLNDYIQQVPVLPMVLSFVGAFVALSTIGKFLLYTLAGGYLVGTAIHRSNEPLDENED